LNVVPRSTKLLIQEHVLDEITLYTQTHTHTHTHTYLQKVNTVPLWCYANDCFSSPSSSTQLQQHCLKQ